jgi:ABC-2 type transport system permease protein
MLSVYRKEMRSYFVSPIPYVLIIIFVGFMAWFVFGRDNFWFFNRASLELFFEPIPLVFMVLIPGLTMRLWSEEARGGTLETLMTAPVRSWQLVGGKFLSAWTLLAIALLCTLSFAISVATLGQLDWGQVMAGYLGTLLMGAALLALGLWISALTNHQIVAFLLTAITIFALVILSWTAPKVGGDLGRFLNELALGTRFQSVGRGVLDLRDVLYFASFTLLFLYLNAQAVENRRYR